MILHIDDDFDLYKIVHSGQCFRAREISENKYYFVTKTNDITILDLGNNDFDVSCTKEEWSQVWHHYFDLDTSYADIRARIPKSDTYLVKSAQIGSGIRILNQDKFEMLISFIISQRKSIPAIRSSVEKICKLYGKDGFFPTPSELYNATSNELSECGLGYRVPYISEATRRVALGEIDLEMLSSLSDEDLFEQLKSFYGVGDKVANCVALFAYHRIGRAPVDTWIQKIIDTAYNGVNPFPNYGEYAGIMQQYMFYAAQHFHEIQ